MNISHHNGVDNSSRVVPAHFTHSPKDLARAASQDARSSCALPQKPHSHKVQKIN